ncbi:sensor histidine kinase [Candidatus Sumerlaeota bacterium]|nr:sensor histidine kinase [Candidatus Sumerlaeota bacterium]
MISAAGEAVWIHDLVHVESENGSPKVLRGFMIDITGRKRGEESILHYQDQLRALAAELSRTQDRERRRLAEALHDQIGQTLVLTRMKLGALKKASSPEERTSLSDEIDRLIQTAISEARSLMHEISPQILYELGFNSAIDWLAERIERQYGLICSIDHDLPSVQLSEETKVALFQSVRELLINVAKHASASRATLRLQSDNGNIRVEVQDDGKGFNLPDEALASPPEGGFGLFSIRERLRPLGGTIVVHSSPGQGTRVTLTAPIER